MARIKKSKTPQKPASGLEDPFPSSPMRPPKYGVYVSYRGEFMCYVNFAAKYAAKKFVDLCLSGNDHKWVDGTRSGGGEAIEDSTGLLLEGLGLEEVLDHRLNSLEEAWQLPEPYIKQAQYIRIKRVPMGVKLEERVEGGAKELPQEKPREPKKARIDKSGLITIGSIAEELGIDAGEARKILRNKKVEKPEAGWAWPEDEAEDIKKLLA